MASQALSDSVSDSSDCTHLGSADSTVSVPMVLLEKVQGSDEVEFGGLHGYHKNIQAKKEDHEVCNKFRK